MRPKHPAGHTWVIRKIMRFLLRVFFRIFTRLEIKGTEHVPDKGPVLVLPNHVSNLDAPLLIAYFPYGLEIMGPGDFKMVRVKDVMMRLYDFILIKRGHKSSRAVKIFIDLLRENHFTMLFPQGGMWEKRDRAIKEGAAYISQRSQAPILPVGISGAYLKAKALWTFRRPRITLTYGPLLPPVCQSEDKSKRKQDLEDASQTISARIFELLEPDERDLYRRWEKATYSIKIANTTNEELDVADPFSTLAEFISKPNLFRPMYKNARLKIAPFRQERFYAAEVLQKAAEDLCETLKGDYDRYIPYRLGDEAQESIVKELTALAAVADQARGQRIKIEKITVDQDI